MYKTKDRKASFTTSQSLNKTSCHYKCWFTALAAMFASSMLTVNVIFLLQNFQLTSITATVVDDASNIFPQSNKNTSNNIIHVKNSYNQPSKPYIDQQSCLKRQTQSFIHDYNNDIEECEGLFDYKPGFTDYITKKNHLDNLIWIPDSINQLVLASRFNKNYNKFDSVELINQGKYKETSVFECIYQGWANMDRFHHSDLNEDVHIFLAIFQYYYSLDGMLPKGKNNPKIETKNNWAKITYQQFKSITTFDPTDTKLFTFEGGIKIDNINYNNKPIKAHQIDPNVHMPSYLSNSGQTGSSHSSINDITNKNATAETKTNATSNTNANANNVESFDTQIGLKYNTIGDDYIDNGGKSYDFDDSHNTSKYSQTTFVNNSKSSSSDDQNNYNYMNYRRGMSNHDDQETEKHGRKMDVPGINSKDFVFLEMGAYNGLEDGLSYLYESCLDWKGYLIEANPMIFPYIIRHRPKADKLLLAPSCPFDNQTVNISGVKRPDGGIIGMIREDIKYYDNYKVHCGPLQMYLNDLFVNRIDFFELDVSGSELTVLNNLDWSKINQYDNTKGVGKSEFGYLTIDVFMIEMGDPMCVWNKKYCEKTEKIRKIMFEQGFHLIVGLSRTSDVYIHKDSKYCKLLKEKYFIARMFCNYHSVVTMSGLDVVDVKEYSF